MRLSIYPVNSYSCNSEKIVGKSRTILSLWFELLRLGLDSCYLWVALSAGFYCFANVLVSKVPWLKSTALILSMDRKYAVPLRPGSKVRRCTFKPGLKYIPLDEKDESYEYFWAWSQKYTTYFLSMDRINGVLLKFWHRHTEIPGLASYLGQFGWVLWKVFRTEAIR